MSSNELRKKFLNFFAKREHTIVPSSSLIPSDPSVLFTTAGMQQFKGYFLGEKSPYGNRVASCQKCLRTSDIDEVGDENHLTFFEMMGNFSFGGYFKEEAIQLAYRFITEELKLKIDYVTVFSPDKVTDNDWRKGVEEDKESFEVWKKLGIPKDKIKKEGVDNFWGPTGDEGPCGPTTEIYVNGVEIWNIVFNEFFCDQNKKLEKLETSGVDTGMGLERLAMVAQKKETVFETDLFAKPFPGNFAGYDIESWRIVMDHLRGSVFLIADGVRPSNKETGYVLRRLIRRTIVRSNALSLPTDALREFLRNVIEHYGSFYKELIHQENDIIQVFLEEKARLEKTIEEGLKEFFKKYPALKVQTVKEGGMLEDHLIKEISGEDAFYFHQSYGLTIDIIKDLAKRGSHTVDESRFETAFQNHQEISRTASAGMFKGGLADEKPATIKLHTAHHLLLATLQELFGKSVKQKGSNINSERLRMDFSFDRKLTDEEKKKIEDMVNQRIKAGLLVVKREMPRSEAEKIGAEMEFGMKYGDTVSVYFVEDASGNVFSKEFCGGPHVKNTLEIGHFKIIKEEPVGAGARRIRAIVE